MEKKHIDERIAVADFEKIKRLLHHRFPFLMVDRVIECEKGISAVAIKNITGNEICFLGHFPHKAIMPGVLLIEAMAQTGALLLMLTHEMEVLNAEEVYYLVGVKEARFLSPVVPGDQLFIRVEAIKLIEYAGIVKAEIKVDDRIVARSQLIFGGKGTAGDRKNDRESKKAETNN